MKWLSSSKLAARIERSQRRLESLGEEWALARTGYQLRYWRFVRALVGLDAASDPRCARLHPSPGTPRRAA